MSDTTQPVFDVAFFEAADTGILEVLNQKEEPLLFNGAPVSIELYGPGSEQYVKAQAKLDSASQARAFAAIRGKVSKDPNESRNQTIEKLVAVTKSINNFPLSGGAQALYANPRLGYITAQVAKFIEDWGNFPSASTTT